MNLVHHLSAFRLDPAACFASKPFDHVFTDPPFSPHVHDNATTAAVGGGYGTSHNDLGFAPLSHDLQTHIASWVKTARKWSLIYSDVEGVAAWVDALGGPASKGGHYIRTIPWIRWSTPQKSGDRPVQGFECVILAWGSQPGSKRVHWHGPGNLVELEHECLLEELDALRHKARRGAEKHKTEKPLDQALDLVDWFSDPGDLIVDLCAGRGTFGAAVEVVNSIDGNLFGTGRVLPDRSFLGFEINPVEVEKANARLALLRDGTALESTPGGRSDLERIRRWLDGRRVENRPAPAPRKAREVEPVEEGGAMFERSGDDDREGMFG